MNIHRKSYKHKKKKTIHLVFESKKNQPEIDKKKKKKTLPFK